MDNQVEIKCICCGQKCSFYTEKDIICWICKDCLEKIKQKKRIAESFYGTFLRGNDASEPLK